MTTMTVTAARDDLSETVNLVHYGNQRIVLERNGKQVAALVSIRDLRLLRLLEDRLDVSEAEAALADPERIPWEKVKADLGIKTKTRTRPRTKAKPARRAARSTSSRPK